MNVPVATREVVREIDRCAVEEYHVPGVLLMENAGRGVADVLCELGIKGPVVICCGRGNNAGDGLVIARHLDLRGYATRLLFWSDPGELDGDARQNWDIARRAELPLHVLPAHHDEAAFAKHLDGADWIVDALLGTGARGAPRPPLDRVIEQLNAHGAKKLAVDIPSGLDCDSGQPAHPCFRADHTCTFVAAKPGLVVPGAQPWVGHLHVLDIGAPRRLLRQYHLSL